MDFLFIFIDIVTIRRSMALDFWQFAERAAELGQSYLAIPTTETSMGRWKHLKACQESESSQSRVLEAYWRPDRHVREPDWRYLRWHMILLATSLKGWHNLIRFT